MPLPTSATRLVALLGHPVAHSASPQIHNAAFAETGVEAVYVACDVPPEHFDAAVDAVQAMGFLGANVTVPHKRAAYLRVPRRTPAADACGAANTLFFDGGTLTVDNTDVEGLDHVLRHDVGLSSGQGAVIVGSGGAARAAAVALGALGARVDVVARREQGATEIRAIAAAAGADDPVASPRLVINATPLGLHGEVLPDPFMSLRPDQVALDLVYGPADTPFVAAARRAGAQAMDGRGMLVAQAAASFQRWTGLDAPRETMARAAARALQARA